jgi:Zn-dependent protease
MRFSGKEKKDLFYAGILISLAFAILLSGGLEEIFRFNENFLIIFAMSFFTAGLAFLLHESMHKYAAQSYGLKAEFRAYYPGLFLAIIFSLAGFIIAAPGAVYISGRINRKMDGKISLAGPLTNIILAVIFLIPLLLIQDGLLTVFFKFGLTINSLLAAFNLLPFAPFDGGKVYSWNKLTYAISLIVAIGLFITSMII